VSEISDIQTATNDARKRIPHMATATVRKSARKSVRKSDRVIFGPLFVLIEQHEDGVDQIIMGDMKSEDVKSVATEMNRITRGTRFSVREVETDSIRFRESFRSAKGGAV